jgi:hypothetical protein
MDNGRRPVDAGRRRIKSDGARRRHLPVESGPLVAKAGRMIPPTAGLLSGHVGHWSGKVTLSHFLGFSEHDSFSIQ